MTDVIVKGVLGGESKIKKQVLLEIIIGKRTIPQQCLVLEKLTNDLILGYDFIFNQNEITDPAKNSAIFRAEGFITTIGNEVNMRGLIKPPTLPPISDDAAQKNLIAQEFADIFSDQKGEFKEFELTLQLINTTPYEKTYPIPEAYLPEVQREIEELVRKRETKRN